MTAASPQREPLGELSLECIALPLDEVVNGDRRLDAELYLSEGFLRRREIEQSALRTALVGDLADVWQPSRLKGIQVEPEHGAPYLLATQVFDVWPQPRKWLALSKIPKPRDYFVEPGWILVTRSGTVGNPIITYTPHVDRVVSDDLLRVQVTEDAFRGYLYTFFRTRYGRALMRSSHYGNVIKHLEVDHLARVPVPIIDKLVAELGETIDTTFTMRDEAYRLDGQALQLFSDAIGDEPSPAPEEGFPVDAGSLFGRSRRLDAYAYNPDALAVLETLKANAEGLTRLIDVATPTQPSRFRRVYGDLGFPYLSADDVFRINPEITKFLTQATDTDLSALRVKSGWLLMACSGQIYGINGSVYLATKWHEDKILSHDMIRIVPTEGRIRAGYLLAALSHPTFGRPLVLRNAYGTSIPHLESPDIAEFPVARLAKSKEDEIADAVEKASELRMKADENENGAVARLEEELEAELEKSGEKKKHGPLRIPLDFDEAMKRAVQVPPPDEDAAEEA